MRQPLNHTQANNLHPSFRQLLANRARFAQLAWNGSGQPYTTELQMGFKLRNISLAMSHGIKTAPIFEVWHDIDSLDFSRLSGEFVLKADGGSSAHAVFPLVKTSRGLKRANGATITTAEIKEYLKSLGTRARAPYYAEAMLYPLDSANLDDIKVYCAYGEILQVLLIHGVDEHRRETVRRYVSSKGRDLGEVSIGDIYSPAIPTPTELEEVAKQARHLSKAVGSAFCRVDFYSTTQGVVFGEITRSPGGAQIYTKSHDREMAEKWLKAAVRLEGDHNRGRPRGTLFGGHDYTWFYRNSSDIKHPSSWPRTVTECKLWCF